MSISIKYESQITVIGENLVRFYDSDESEVQILKMDGQKVKEFKSIVDIIKLSENKFALIDREKPNVLYIVDAKFSILNEYEQNDSISSIEALSDSLIAVCINAKDIALIRVNDEKVEKKLSIEYVMSNAIKKLNNNSFATVFNTEISIWNLSGRLKRTLKDKKQRNFCQINVLSDSVMLTEHIR